MGFAKTWPEHSQQILEDKLSDKNAFHILLVGSDAIGNEKLGLLTPLKEALASKYDQYVTIESIVYEGTTSDYVSDEEYESLIDKKPDMQVSDLEKYAEAEEISYWNHREAWPDRKDRKVEDYYKELDGDKSIANEQGFEVWSEYLANKLISE